MKTNKYLKLVEKSPNGEKHFFGLTLQCFSPFEICPLNKENVRREEFFFLRFIYLEIR